MADRGIVLNGVPYEIARDKLTPEGARRFTVSARPSQPTDPTLPTQAMEWITWNDNFHSFEIIPPGQTTGPLQVDYGINTDSRWDGINTLGPATTLIDLSGTSGTGATTNCAELSRTMNATANYIYIGRGNHLAKVDKTTLLRVVEASANLGGNVQCLLYTKSTNGTQEISVGLRTVQYPVLTTCSNAGVNDVYTNNSSAVVCSQFFSFPDRTFGAQDTTGAAAATLRFNVLTGAVTMAAPVWTTAATMPTQNFLINGLINDGNFLMVGTDSGIQTLDPDYNKFRVIDPGVSNDSTNCTAVGTWMPVGTFFNLLHALRFLKWGEGSSVGPEAFTGNTSPVTGRCTAIWGTDRWLFAVFLNPITTDSWLCAAAPRKPTDNHANVLSWYTLRKFTATTCGFGKDLGTIGGAQTLETELVGFGTDAVYFQMGRTTRWPDDTSYLYTLTGTTFLTESRRDMDLIKDVEAIEFVSSGCNANQTITVGASFDGATAVTLTGSTVGVNDVVSTNGFQRRFPVDNSGVPLTTWSGYRIKPQFAFSTNTSSAAPAVVGKWRVLYRARPKLTKVIDCVLVLKTPNQSQKSPVELEAQLLTEWGSGPVSLEDIESSTTYYVRATAVKVERIRDTGQNENRAAGDILQATVQLVVWPTTSGS